jgi:parallel beta helix pectate lyase-like protein
MLLQNKNVIIYGTGGSLGSASEMAGAKEGAYVLVRPSIKKAVLFSTLLCFFSIILCAQHSYYFSAKSRPGGNGTQQMAFDNLESIKQIKIQPGDKIYFHGGDTLKGNISLDQILGTKNQKIIFTSYGKGKAYIDGGTGEAMGLVGCENIIIRGLSFLGAGRKSGNTKDGVKLVDCRQVHVNAVIIEGFQKSGLLIYNSQDIVIDSVFAHDNGSAGITVEGDYQKRFSNRIHFIHCRTDNNPGDPTNLTNHSGNGLVVGNCKNVLIEYCTATNNGWDMPRIGNGPVGIWAWEADSVIIQNCISYRNKTAKGAADGGGFDLDGACTNSIIQYCLSYENWGTGYGIYQYYGAGKWNNNTVRYCISINDGNITDLATAMHIWNGWNGDSTFTNGYFYNNFFYNDSRYALSFNPLAQHKNFNFFNNIFVASDTSDIYHGEDSSKTDLFLGNLWMNKSGGFSQQDFRQVSSWAAAKGYENYREKFIGLESKIQLFHIPSRIDIVDPYKLRSTAWIRALCVPGLNGKGLDLRKLFSIDVGKIDFFGHPIAEGRPPGVGICN